MLPIPIPNMLRVGGANDWLDQGGEASKLEGFNHKILRAEADAKGALPMLNCGGINFLNNVLHKKQP